MTVRRLTACWSSTSRPAGRRTTSWRGPPARRDPQGRARRHARPDGDRCARARHRPRHPAARPPGAGRPRATTPPSGSGSPPSPTTPRATSSTTARRARPHRRAIARRCAAYVGDIEQVPSAVSAIKIDGERAYKRVRAGEDVELAGPAGARSTSSPSARSARGDAVVDVDVHVECSTGHLHPGARARPRRRPRCRRPPDRAAAHPGRRLRARRAHSLDALAELEPRLPVDPLDDAAAANFATSHGRRRRRCSRSATAEPIDRPARRADGPGRRAHARRRVPRPLRAARPGRQGDRCLRPRLTAAPARRERTAPPEP